MKLPRKYNTEILLIVALIAVGSIAVRILIKYNFDNSALLYIGIPFAISMALIAFTYSTPNPSWKQRYWNIIRNSLIIMLASSVVLFEGFLCVVMYMPIHFFVLALAFIIQYFLERAKKSKGNHLAVHILPVILVIAAFEGTHSNISFERYNEVSATKIVQLNVNQIKDNLAKPINIDHDRSWFLELFPMPYQINAGSLQAGDIHEIYFRYHRWFFTNTHKGRMLLKIDKVSNNKIQTKFIEDTSYISTYLKLHGTQILLEPIDEKSTKITLTVKFDRKLDPAWYFGPLERYGVKKMADHLILNIMENTNNIPISKLNSVAINQ